MKKGQKDVPILVLLGILCFMVCLYGAELHHIIDKEIQSAAAETRELPIYSVETQEPRIALTFDIATGTEDLAQILNVLEQHQVKATFFLLGSWIRHWPQEVKMLYEAGHELANHGNHHVDYTELGLEECKREIVGAQEEIRALTGYTTVLFRPPYGSYNNTVIQAAKEGGYAPIQWSVDSLDWKEYGKEEMIERVLHHAQLGNGAILLFHNNTKYTAASLDAILTGLEEQGYRIGTVSDLIWPEGGWIDSQGRQHPAS